MKWRRNTKQWYEGKGYIFTKFKDEFIINPEDLSSGTRSLVEVQCDGCGKILTGVRWIDYNKGVKGDGKYYCHKCGNAGFKKFTSFEQWCYDNLPKKEADEILLRWDYELNINKNGKLLDPQNISYTSHGLNKKGYWFKCLEHLEHKSELKGISSFTMGQKGSINCHQCNSIALTHPELVKFLANKEDASVYSIGERKKLNVKCLDCGYEKEIYFYALVNQGFGCPRCGDGISYPEKFMLNLLEQINNTDFQTQLNKTTFKWCGKYKYDFYVDRINCIIETHGIQHYRDIFWSGESLKKTQENDFNKEKLAVNNSIVNYIVLDCRKSEIEWIKNSIMTSNLPKLLNFQECDIDWFKCHEHSCSSLVKTVCDLWSGGINNTLRLAKILKIHNTTVIRYLKQGAELSWCNYDPKNEMRRKEYLYKKIMCLTTNESFNSILEASRIYNINKSGISQCCNKNKINKSAGKHPITGEKMVWMYLDEYEKIFNEVRTVG